MAPRPHATRVREADDLAGLFERDRGCHLYGLADLAEPYWSRSTWWRRGDAAVGVVRLPDSDAVAFYAISPRAPEDTLGLFVDVADEVPAGATGSGPIGLVERLGRVRGVEDLGTRAKLVVDRASLRRDQREPLDDVAVVELTEADHDELLALHATDPGAVFFVRSMWRGGRHVGIRDGSARDSGGRLVAAAGTHVLDHDHGVAAIGAVLTHPDQRGRGLAARVVHALADRLLADGLTVGLNVREANTPAVRLYARLGFRRVHRYEEARLH